MSGSRGAPPTTSTPPRSALGHGLGRWLSQPEAPVVYGGVGPQISLPHPKEAPCSGAPDEPEHWAWWGGTRWGARW